MACSSLSLGIHGCVPQVRSPGNCYSVSVLLSVLTLLQNRCVARESNTGPPPFSWVGFATQAPKPPERPNHPSRASLKPFRRRIFSMNSRAKWGAGAGSSGRLRATWTRSGGKTRVHFCSKRSMKIGPWTVDLRQTST